MAEATYELEVGYTTRIEGDTLRVDVAIGSEVFAYEADVSGLSEAERVRLLEEVQA